MSWTLSYKLDSSTYVPLQKGVLSNIRLTNTSGNKMIVTEVLLQFDWMGTYRFTGKCNVKVDPGSSVELPEVSFSIDLGAPIGSHNYKPGISCLLLEDEKWVPHNDEYVVRGDFIEIKQLPAKDFTVFVSHSNDESDKNIVKACKDAMNTCGLTGYFAEDDSKPGFRLWDKIAVEVAHCDAFLVLLTESASKAGDVREEVGIAVGAGKNDRIVPVVENGIEVQGSLRSRGIEWVDYSPPKDSIAVSKAFGTLIGWAVEKEKKKEQKERRRKKGMREKVQGDQDKQTESTS